MWDKIKCTDIPIINVSERRDKGTESIIEDIETENFPNLEKEIDFQVRKYRAPDKINPKRSTLKATW